MSKLINIAIVDDHPGCRKALAVLLTQLGYSILYKCVDGKDLLEKLDRDGIPHLILIDTNMPVMDGYETAVWVSKNYPSTKVLAMGMEDDEKFIRRMINNGARGYILKFTSKEELKEAIETVLSNDIYYPDLTKGIRFG